MLHIVTLSLPDVTVELASREDSFLLDIVLLMLEIKLDNRIVDKVNLLSRESAPGIWDADQVVVL
jgi:hypothetical protein